MGVPAVSIKNIYKSLLAFENQYNNEPFFKRVIEILKLADVNTIQGELENQMIPEKLLALSQHTATGFVIYDYPNNIKQAEK